MNALVETEINQLSAQVFKIESQEDLIKINAVLKGIKQLKKAVEDELNPEIEKANAAHKGLTALKNKHLQPLKEVEEKINAELKAWTSKKEAEAIALQEKINKDLAESAASQETNEWAKEVAKENAVTVNLKDCKETVAPKVEGQYKRSNWKARIVNPTLIPRSYWIIDEKALDLVAKKEKGQLEIPGVEFYDDFTIVTKV